MAILILPQDSASLKSYNNDILKNFDVLDLTPSEMYTFNCKFSKENGKLKIFFESQGPILDSLDSHGSGTD